MEQRERCQQRKSKSTCWLIRHCGAVAEPLPSNRGGNSQVERAVRRGSLRACQFVRFEGERLSDGPDFRQCYCVHYQAVNCFVNGVTAVELHKIAAPSAPLFFSIGRMQKSGVLSQKARRTISFAQCCKIRGLTPPLASSLRRDHSSSTSSIRGTAVKLA
jgi:hypothetical protein